jgi:hypothetical protein
MSWKHSDSHRSKTFKGKEHFDVEKFDNKTGKKDKKAGKLHISGKPHKKSMKDIHSN